MAAGKFLPQIKGKQAGGQLDAPVSATVSVITSSGETGRPMQGTPAPTAAFQPVKEDEQVISSAQKGEADIGVSKEPAQPPQNPPTLVPADAYLSVQIGQAVYDPIPLLGDNELSLKQEDGKVNVVGFSKTGIWMKSSTCHNQACVHQGTVTLDNMSNRVLQNLIICLPNEVILSLLTPKEAQSQWDALYEAEKAD